MSHNYNIQCALGVLLGDYRKLRKFASDEYSSNSPNRPYFPVCSIYKQKIEFEFEFVDDGPTTPTGNDDGEVDNVGDDHTSDDGEVGFDGGGVISTPSHSFRNSSNI